MEHAIFIPSSVMATNVDSLNRSFKASRDVDNGSVFVKGALSTTSGEGQVFTAGLPTANTLGLWMAFTAEDTIVTIGGNQYKLDLVDPRLFTNITGLVFSGFKPMVDDIITISADGILGEEDDYIIADPTTGKLKFASAKGTGMAWEVLEKTYLSVAGASAFGTQRVTAYKLQCLAN